MKKKVIYTSVILILILLFVFIFVIKADKKTIPVEQWALKNSGIEIRGQKGEAGTDLNVERIWKYTEGDSNLTVAILDTGIQTNLESIKESIDPRGKNFFSDEKELYHNFTSDYHGTMLASIISSAHTPDSEVWGIAPKLKILPLKFMEGRKGSIKSAIEGIEYANKLGITIINCSWDTEIYNVELFDTIKKFNNILFITSTGKGGYNLEDTPVYPAAYPLENIISVAALENNGTISKLSGYGLENTVYAPGGNIKVIDPMGNYNFVDGSSYATAYVTALVGLMKSENPNLSNTEIKKMLLNNKFDNKLIDTQSIFKKIKEDMDVKNK